MTVPGNNFDKSGRRVGGDVSCSWPTVTVFSGLDDDLPIMLGRSRFDGR